MCIRDSRSIVFTPFLFISASFFFGIISSCFLLIILLKNQKEAVSYTHLDVYKRQEDSQDDDYFDILRRLLERRNFSKEE